MVLPPVPQPRRDREDRRCQVPRRGRAAPLVRHHAQPDVLLRGAQHGAHEVLAGRRIHPGGPQHDGARPCGQHGLLPFQLRRAVHASRIGRIGLGVGRALGTVEHVVGRDVDQRDAGIGAVRRERRRAGGGARPGRFRRGLRRIDRGPGGGVDHEGRLHGLHRLRDRRRAVEIERRATHATHDRAAFLLHRRCELPGAAGDHDRRHGPQTSLLFPSLKGWRPGTPQNSGGASAQRGSSRSLSDSTASPSPTGQGSARSGSFQATPRSDARSYTSVTL